MPGNRAVLMILGALIIKEASPAPQFPIFFKDGTIGVNFLGFKASAGLNNLLNGGGLHAEAETPFGQKAGAGLGGIVKPDGSVGGQLFAGATAGGNVKAAAGLGGAVEGGEAPMAVGGLYSAASAGPAKAGKSVAGGISDAGSYSISENVADVPAKVVKRDEGSKPTYYVRGHKVKFDRFFGDQLEDLPNVQRVDVPTKDERKTTKAPVVRTRPTEIGLRAGDGLNFRNGETIPSTTRRVTQAPVVRVQEAQRTTTERQRIQTLPTRTTFLMRSKDIATPRTTTNRFIFNTESQKYSTPAPTISIEELLNSRNAIFERSKFDDTQASSIVRNDVITPQRFFQPESVENFIVNTEKPKIQTIVTTTQTIPRQTTTLSTTKKPTTTTVFTTQTTPRQTTTLSTTIKPTTTTVFTTQTTPRQTTTLSTTIKPTIQTTFSTTQTTPRQTTILTTTKRITTELPIITYSTAPVESVRIQEPQINSETETVYEVPDRSSIKSNNVRERTPPKEPSILETLSALVPDYARPDNFPVPEFVDRSFFDIREQATPRFVKTKYVVSPQEPSGSGLASFFSPPNVESRFAVEANTGSTKSRTFFDDIFNIPISTLGAVSRFLSNSVPAKATGNVVVQKTFTTNQ